VDWVPLDIARERLLPEHLLAHFEELFPRAAA
jgi:hypothetical protein